MDTGSSTSSYTETDEKNLVALLDAFGSLVSLNDIASAYVQSGRDLQSTAEKLCIIQQPNGSRSSLENTILTECSSIQHPTVAKSKLKTSSASVGTVSGIIGKGYYKPKPQSNVLIEKIKPVKLSSDDIPISEIWDETNDAVHPSHSKSMDTTVEEFLCKMLGKGFHLEKSDIQNVIGQCGYNMSMSIDKLLELSAGTLEKSADIIGTKNSTENCLEPELMNGRETDSRADLLTREQVMQGQTGINGNLQKEILESLFSDPELNEEKQENPSRENWRPTYYPIVSEPLKVDVPDFTFINKSPVKRRDDEANEISYEELRKAVKEYWGLMKVYLKAGADAFAKNDYEAAKELMEMGNFFMRKAREADEKSAQTLLENSDEKEEYSVNMHYLGPKDALYHMKLHLTSLSGLPNIRYMKVVTGTSAEDKQDRKRKRLITKLLEEEHIPWTEEGNGWIISIRVDKIDPKKLSFTNK